MDFPFNQIEEILESEMIKAEKAMINHSGDVHGFPVHQARVKTIKSIKSIFEKENKERSTNARFNH